MYICKYFTAMEMSSEVSRVPHAWNNKRDILLFMRRCDKIEIIRYMWRHVCVRYWLVLLVVEDPFIKACSCLGPAI